MNAFPSLAWHDFVGLVGVSLVLFAFFLLQAGRLRGDRLPYQLLNACGASLVLLSLLFAFNLSAFVLEGLWLLISVYGMARGWRQRKERG